MKTLNQYINEGLIKEELGTPLFRNMPSNNKDKYRSIKIDFNEYKKLYTDQVKKIIEDAGFVLGINNKNVVIAIAIEGTYDSVNKDYYKWHKLIDPYEKRIQKLINTLDKKTDIYFESSWAGNVGWKSEKIVYKAVSTTYGRKNLYDDMKYDFNDLSAVESYVLQSMKKFGQDNTTILYYNRNDINCYKKSSKKSTNLKYDDLKEEILEYANQFAKSINKDYNIELSTGKRQSDNNSDSYEAFVVYKGKAQYGHFTLSQNKFGDMFVSVRVPLCGESKADLDLNNWKPDIEKIIKRIYSK